MSIIKEYYDNGNLKAEGITLNGLKEGIWTFFFERGNVCKEINYSEGMENGIWKMWHENGNLYIEQNKIDGKSVGYWKEYYESGATKEIGIYDNNEYIPIDFWDESGNQLLKEGTGKKIERFGSLGLDVFEHYFENGKFIKEIKISSGEYGKFIPKQ
jgi:antitoxin component YwqK of YwqJK toxin-antitoxin module